MKKIVFLLVLLAAACGVQAGGPDGLGLSVGDGSKSWWSGAHVGYPTPENGLIRLFDLPQYTDTGVFTAFERGGMPHASVTMPPVAGSMQHRYSGFIWSGNYFTDSNITLNLSLSNLRENWWEVAVFDPSGSKVFDHGTSDRYWSAELTLTPTPRSFWDWRTGYRVEAATTKVVPEPASMMVLGTGLVGLAGMIRRRKQ